MAVASPCNTICEIDPLSGHCLGCRRTLDEIAAWGKADDRWKQSVLEKLKARPIRKD